MSYINVILYRTDSNIWCKCLPAAEYTCTTIPQLKSTESYSKPIDFKQDSHTRQDSHTERGSHTRRRQLRSITRVVDVDYLSVWSMCRQYLNLWLPFDAIQVSSCVLCAIYCHDINEWMAFYMTVLSALSFWVSFSVQVNVMSSQKYCDVFAMWCHLFIAWYAVHYNMLFIYAIAGTSRYTM